jgi:hypothetical protein
MRARLGAIVAAAAVAIVVPAHAATPAGPAPQITDPGGDANFINGQTFVDTPDETTPVDASSADITGVLFQTTYATQTLKKTVVKVVKKKKVKKVITITVNLAAAPGPDTIYRVTAAKGACTRLFFEYSTSPASQAIVGSTNLRCASSEEDTTYDIAPATVTGSSIKWTVPLSQLPLNTQLTNLGAETAVDSLALTAPFYDIASGTASFTVGK